MNNSVNTLRVLGVEMINKANSGHPGIVLGAAPIVYALYKDHMNINPNKDDWFNRDRFIMAAGHGSALLYANLHLCGYDLTMNDLKDFRQFGSKTPGHPEYKHTKGVDATSGPLGQGIAMGTGMAIAEEHLSALFNKDDIKVVDNYTYVLCGDGDLQEGVTQEAMSMAGHLGLSKLVVLYDSNDIQLDGSVDMTNTENVKMKYESMNWNYIKVSNGNCVDDISNAIKEAKLNGDKPTIIEVKTKIGHGSTLEGLSDSHGSPLGEELTLKLRDKLCYSETSFSVNDDVYNDYKNNVVKKGIIKFEEWNKKMETYSNKYPKQYKELMDIINNEPLNFDVKKYEMNNNVATRVSGGEVLKSLSDQNIRIIGGSADLTKSTKVKGINGDFEKGNRIGRNINYGVREHAMGAVVNGLTLSGLRGFSGGFFVFSDYMKPAMRMAALMGIPSIFVFTHDSIGVGEDGPTHQPIEQLTGLRAIPNLNVMRPGSAAEVRSCYRAALASDSTPTVIVLSRQNVEQLSVVHCSEVAKGGYIASKETKELNKVIIASGSELQLALKVKEKLNDESIRIVSMPSFNLFDKQTQEYKDEIIPKNIEVVALEMASAFEYYKYANKVIGINEFGISAPGSTVINEYGFTVDKVIEKL